MAQPIVVEGIVLSTIRYGESSRIARLATRELGVQSVIAKGALRPRSRFGGGLQPLSIGQGMVVLSARSELHLLTGFDLLHLPAGLAAVMDRYAAGLALAEVMLRFAPAGVHEPSYQGFKRALLELEVTAPASAEVVGLHWLWQLIGVLGFAPDLRQCVLDGAAVPGEGPLPFSLTEGGALCPACARSHAVTWLPEADRADLIRVLAGTDDLPVMERSHAAAHRRLLGRYLRHQLGGDADLPALDFWQQRSWEAA
ncbi:MAG: DNA repair protein RecO [Gemmatimonadota bacterium]